MIEDKSCMNCIYLETTTLPCGEFYSKSRMFEIHNLEIIARGCKKGISNEVDNTTTCNLHTSKEDVNFRKIGDGVNE